ncbi:hypothetical protein Nmel_013783, partial [Mimus melanotis]
APNLPEAPFEPQKLKILSSLTIKFCTKLQLQLNVTPHHPVYKISNF